MSVRSLPQSCVHLVVISDSAEASSSPLGSGAESVSLLQGACPGWRAVWCLSLPHSKHWTLSLQFFASNEEAQHLKQMPLSFKNVTFSMGFSWKKRHFCRLLNHNTAWVSHIISNPASGWLMCIALICSTCSADSFPNHLNSKSISSLDDRCKPLFWGRSPIAGSSIGQYRSQGLFKAFYLSCSIIYLLKIMVLLPSQKDWHFNILEFNFQYPLFL